MNGDDIVTDTRLEVFPTDDGRIGIKTFQGCFYFTPRDAASFALVMLKLSLDADKSINLDALFTEVLLSEQDIAQRPN